MAWEVTWTYDATKILYDTFRRSIGEAFGVPTGKENNMVPQSLGDALDILSGLAGNTTEAGKKMHDHIEANVQEFVHGMGLYLKWSENEEAYILVSDCDRKLGK